MRLIITINYLKSNSKVHGNIINFYNLIKFRVMFDIIIQWFQTYLITSKKQQNTQTYEIKDNIFPSSKYTEKQIIYHDNLSKSRSFYTLASSALWAL